MMRAAPKYQRSRLALLLVVGAVLGLALLNWRLLTMDIDISPSSGADAADPALLSASDWLPGETGTAEAVAYPEMLARPLFRSSRRQSRRCSRKSGTGERAGAGAGGEIADDIQSSDHEANRRAGRALIRLAPRHGQWVKSAIWWGAAQRIEAAACISRRMAKTEAVAFPAKDE